MFLLLGSSGYVGQAFLTQLLAGGYKFIAPSHAELDASSRQAVQEAIEQIRPTFVINAIGYTGRPNIDSTEREKLRCVRENILIPGILGEILGDKEILLGHVSSGCIYDGTRPDGSPFTEEDPPNFAFSHPQASWYSRTKAMAEVMLSDCPNAMIWRLRIPFDQFDHSRNYLTKLMKYERLLEVSNSISQLQEYAATCIQTLLRRLPTGIYNVTNPGAIRTSEVVEAMKKHGVFDKDVQFFDDESAFLAAPGRVKRASCSLSSEKIASHGLPMRDVNEALDWSLRNWQPQRLIA